MKVFPQIIFLGILSFCRTLPQKNSDEGRPYEFGFTIDGQQHRHEKKDERGIVQGEFGFITADGIYHVTVYATDENGKFKILSMRNIRISAPLDGSPFKGEISPEANKYRKQANLAPLPETPQAAPNALSIPEAAPQQVVTTPKNEPIKFTLLPTVKPACASCGYITTTKKPVPAQSSSYQPGFGTPQQAPGSRPQYQSAASPQNTNYNAFGTVQGTQGGQLSSGGNAAAQGINNTPYGGGLSSGALEPNPLQLPGQGPANDVSTLPPIAVSDNVIHVGGDRKQDIPIKDKFPGMSDGLPEGIEEKDITNLLYKFHYTVGFHGHYEKGLKNGAKIGGYFVNGRDGISRVVTYIADENGYRPKVKFINLGLDSDETPKADTEKTFGLKSFEFVWYPV